MRSFGWTCGPLSNRTRKFLARIPRARRYQGKVERAAGRRDHYESKGERATRLAWEGNP